MKQYKKKWVALLLCLGLVLAVAVRIWSVNAHAFAVNEKVYQMGEWIPLEGDFFYSEEEGTKDYSVRVSSAEVLSYEKFMSKFGKTEDYLASANQHDIIMLKVDFRNDGDVQGGAFIRDSNLLNQYRSAVYNKDDEYMKIANDTFTPDTFGITVSPHTQASMYYVYTTAERTDGVSYLDELSGQKNTKMYLVVSLYPTQKLIEINLDFTKYNDE